MIDSDNLEFCQDDSENEDGSLAIPPPGEDGQDNDWSEKDEHLIYEPHSNDENLRISDKQFYKEMQKLKDRSSTAGPPKKSASAYIIFCQKVSHHC
jgi:hypothetical protein